MADWNSDLYLKFEKQRTQPAIDLARRVQDYSFAKIADLGCGTGNSTYVLNTVFRNAEIIGFDNSENMIKKAKELYPKFRFELCDVNDIKEKYDLIFSNACLQWIPNHEALIPKLISLLNKKGVLAVQMPMNREEPLYRIIEEVAVLPEYDFSHTHFEKNGILSPEKYFDLIFSCGCGFDIWETVYYHEMPSHEELINWVKGTRLRPYLNALEEKQKADFEEKILKRVKERYVKMKNGKIIFKFRRLFFIAEKP